MKRHGKLALFVFLSGIAFGAGVGTRVTEWRQAKVEASARAAEIAAAAEAREADTAERLSLFFLKTNPHLDRETALDMASAVQEAAGRYALPETILAGLIHTESRANPNAVNKGCLGLTQVNWPVWKKELTLKHPEIFRKRDLFEPRRSILAGAWILRHYLDRYGNLDRALAAYSGGAKWYPEKVRKAAEGL
jgi:soluble lytic murein transglycosylase-like protein